MDFKENRRLSLEPTTVMRTLSSNPGFIIDATEIMGGEGRIVTSDDGIKLGFLNGCAVQVDGPQKQIVTTPWYQSGVFIENMTITANYTQPETNQVIISEYSTILSGKIFKRHPFSHKIVSSTDIYFIHQKGLSNTYGVLPRQVQTNLAANAIFYFDPNYEYRFELYSDSQLQSTQSLVLDYICLNYIPRQSFLNGHPDETDGQYVNVIEANSNLSITTDNNGNGSVTLLPISLNALHDNKQVTNYFFSRFSDINSVTITMNEVAATAATWEDIIITGSNYTDPETGTIISTLGKKINISIKTVKTGVHTVTGSYVIYGQVEHIQV